MWILMELQTGEAMLDTTCIVSKFETYEEAKKAMENIIDEYKREFDLYETFEEYKQVMKEVYNEDVNKEDFEDADKVIYRYANEVRIEARDDFYALLKIDNFVKKQTTVITF